jgi:uncharacterized protein (DUF1330 family)
LAKSALALRNRQELIGLGLVNVAAEGHTALYNGGYLWASYWLNEQSCLPISFSLEQKHWIKHKLETYWAGIQSTMKGHPIEVLVAYGKYEVLQSNPIEGIVIAKFPTVKAAKDWYYGEAYQSVAKHRRKRCDLPRPDRGGCYLALNPW